MDNKEIWIIFSEGTNFFYKYFMKKWFGHVTILTHDNFNWMLVDPSYTEMTVSIISYKISDDVPRLFLNENPNLKIIKLVKKDDFKCNPHLSIIKSFFPRVVSCISLVKYCVGLKGWSLTPYQLYCHLIKMKDNPSRFYEAHWEIEEV